jgi:hypothetical protein
MAASRSTRPYIGAVMKVSNGSNPAARSPPPERPESALCRHSLAPGRRTPYHPKPTVPREIFTAQLPLWDRYLGAVTACSAGSGST